MLGFGCKKIASLLLLSSYGLATLTASLAQAAASPALMNELPNRGVDKMISPRGSERMLHIRSYIYQPLTADDHSIKLAIARQLKTASGPLAAEHIALSEADPLRKLDARTWKRETVTIAPAQNTASSATQPQLLQRITFHYTDRVVASRVLDTRRSMPLTLLAGDYTSHADELINDCTDDGFSASSESLWYYFRPQLPSCQLRIQAEATELQDAAPAPASHASVISASEANRWFVTAAVVLEQAQQWQHKRYPEYDRLFGPSTAKRDLIIYTIFGSHGDGSDPDDLLGREYLTFWQTLLSTYPSLAIEAHGHLSQGVGLSGDKMPLNEKQHDWQNAAPLFERLIDASQQVQASAAASEAFAALRAQTLPLVSARWLLGKLPVRVQSIDAHGQAREHALSIQLRSFYGDDSATSAAHAAARERFKAAFRQGDVLIYTGHSRRGKAALRPALYQAADFNQGYQLLFINSCNSFTYFHDDFYALKPGGSQNLDMVVNGLQTGIEGSGEAAARFIQGLTTLLSFNDLLARLGLRAGSAHEELRLAEGEQDNRFWPARTPLKVGLL